MKFHPLIRYDYLTKLLLELFQVFVYALLHFIGPLPDLPLLITSVVWFVWCFVRRLGRVLAVWFLSLSFCRTINLAVHVICTARLLLPLWLLIV